MLEMLWYNQNTGITVIARVKLEWSKYKMISVIVPVYNEEKRI